MRSVFGFVLQNPDASDSPFTEMQTCILSVRWTKAGRKNKGRAMIENSSISL